MLLQVWRYRKRGKKCKEQKLFLIMEKCKNAK
jgi:hypothetical protein